MVISLLLLWLAVFMLKWGLVSRIVESGDYSPQMAGTLSAFPKAMIRLGGEAWFQQDYPEAIRFFKSALHKDPLIGKGWLFMGEVEKESGNREQARRIVEYVHGLGKRTLRWTWSETLLALDLGLDSVVWKNLNRMIENQRRTADALQLADVLLAGKLEDVDKKLAPHNLSAYMKWLIGWNRIDRALLVREKMAQHGIRDPKGDQWLSARLLGQKRVSEALSLSESTSGGLNNPGFEEDMTGEPFDWRYSGGSRSGWTVKRVAGTSREGGHSMAVVFDGEKNVSFSHLSQVVPIEPGAKYRLSAWWKGEGLTTDQGPFLEVYGYDAKGLHVKSPMLLGTKDWEEVSIEFSVPEECNAVVVRLRRVPSRKLDNKIKGTVWVDDFRLMADRK